MVERGRLAALLGRKSVLLPIVFALCLLAVTTFAPKAHAINEPRNPSNDEITGLWNTGVNNSGNRLNMPGPWGTPTPAPTTTNNEYQDTPYAVDNSVTAGFSDPHWRLDRLISASDGRPHCQNRTSGPAVTIMPPYDGNLDPAGLPDDGGYVWWRRTMSDPANVLLNGSFYERTARWIGSRPNAFHDSEGGTGIGQQSDGSCIDTSSAKLSLGPPRDREAMTTWVYEMEDPFYVGSCVNENTIQLNLYWAADDEMRIILNEGDPDQSDLFNPTWLRGGGVVTQTDINAADFRSGDNTITVMVRSSFPLTGFAIGWDEPDFECNRPDPYFKVYGNDIAAGGNFSPACDITDLPNQRASIYGHARSSQEDSNPGVTEPDHHTGAGAQLGVFALGQIEGFFSGATHSPRRQGPSAPRNLPVSWRYTPESPVNGLTFGNFGDPAIGEGGRDWDNNNRILDPNLVLDDGGKGGEFRCIPNYYEIASESIGTAASNTSSINLQSVTSGFYRPTGGILRIDSSATISGKRTIVVDGDVYIDDSFSYAGYGGVSDMPSVYIIAKGNIYINRSISQISGVFIAQQIDNPPPQDDQKTTYSGGTIYTCATLPLSGGTQVRAVYRNDLADDCNSKLTINGAFIANQIRFLRTNGEVDGSEPNELWTEDSIAEVFKSSAELYLSVPEHLQKPTSGNAQYNSIISLPPIL